MNQELSQDDIDRIIGDFDACIKQHGEGVEAFEEIRMLFRGLRTAHSKQVRLNPAFFNWCVRNHPWIKQASDELIRRGIKCTTSR
jgi:hypothetical protein